jgi:UDP-N-acetylglucosamine--N-acetylmuramyl-(pentapeptide) pyrophosphoryl-undecaprenol N-acetylglucosamine transferase
MVLKEEDLTADSLVSSVEQLYANREQYRQAMTDSNQMDSIQMIVDLIKQVSK